jgi:hypothetical protein
MKKKDIELGFDITSIPLELMVGLPIYSGSKALYQLGKRVSEEFLRKNSGFSHLNDDLLNLLSTQLVEGFSSQVNNSSIISNRKITLNQVDALNILNDSEIKNRIYNTTTYPFINEKFDWKNNQTILELNKNKPKIKDLRISCASCFPSIYSTLISMNKPERYCCEFEIIGSQLFGNYQMELDLSQNSNNLPDIMFTTNSAFFLVGKDYSRFKNYKLYTEIYYYNQVLLKRPFKFSKFKFKNRQKTIAYFEKSIAEQYIKSRKSDYLPIPYYNFEDFYSDPNSINNDFVIAWQPLTKILQDNGWKIVEKSGFRTPVSMMVRNEFLKKKGSIEILEWFSRVFHMELSYQSTHIDLALANLLSDSQFINSYRGHTLKRSN